MAAAAPDSLLFEMTKRVMDEHPGVVGCVTNGKQGHFWVMLAIEDKEESPEPYFNIAFAHPDAPLIDSMSINYAEIPKLIECLQKVQARAPITSAEAQSIIDKDKPRRSGLIAEMLHPEPIDPGSGD